MLVQERVFSSDDRNEAHSTKLPDGLHRLDEGRSATDSIMVPFVRAFERDPQSQATGKSVLKLSKNGKMVADVPATVCQNFDRSGFQRQPKTRYKVLIPFRPTMQHIIVDEYFAAREVDLLHTEIGGGFEVWPQLGGGDLLKP